MAGNRRTGHAPHSAFGNRTQSFFANGHFGSGGGGGGGIVISLG